MLCAPLPPPSHPAFVRALCMTPTVPHYPSHPCHSRPRTLRMAAQPAQNGRALACLACVDSFVHACRRWRDAAGDNRRLELNHRNAHAVSSRDHARRVACPVHSEPRCCARLLLAQFISTSAPTTCAIGTGPRQHSDLLLSSSKTTTSSRPSCARPATRLSLSSVIAFSPLTGCLPRARCAVECMRAPGRCAVMYACECPRIPCSVLTGTHAASSVLRCWRRCCFCVHRSLCVVCFISRVRSY